MMEHRAYGRTNAMCKGSWYAAQSAQGRTSSDTVPANSVSGSSATVSGGSSSSASRSVAAWAEGQRQNSGCPAIPGASFRAGHLDRASTAQGSRMGSVAGGAHPQAALSSLREPTVVLIDRLELGLDASGAPSATTAYWLSELIAHPFVSVVLASRVTPAFDDLLMLLSLIHI